MGGNFSTSDTNLRYLIQVPPPAPPALGPAMDVMTYLGKATPPNLGLDKFNGPQLRTATHPTAAKTMESLLHPDFFFSFLGVAP